MLGDLDQKPMFSTQSNSNRCFGLEDVLVLPENNATLIHSKWYPLLVFFT